MPRKAFVSDLGEAINSIQIDGISNVRKGDDDGEFSFSVDSGQSRPQFELTASVTDVSDYPTEHSCFFMASDCTPSSIAGRLGDLFDQTHGKTVQQLIQLISQTVRADLDGHNDVVMTEIEDDDDLEQSDPESEADADFFYGDPFESSNLTNGHSAAPSTMKPTITFRNQIRQDLRCAKNAGFKVGHLGSLLDGGASYVTVSVRVAKLGISEEAMQAWQIKSSEYLILILYYPFGYQTVDDLPKCDSETSRRLLDMRIGIGSSYKPSLSEAVRAFTKLAKEEEKDQGNKPVEAEPRGINLGFRNAFISGPLNELINERLLRLVSLRYNGMPWAGAEGFLTDHLASTALHGNEVDDKYLVDETDPAKYQELVVADHITEPGTGQPHSFPLIAMQFVLRHFVRCTEFCLVCFRNLKDDFQAIKPYVCDNGLCLYQYMTLGFGPSIEHEILAQPQVVDLLVSFCYTSARGGRLRSYPNGLSLQVPPAEAMTRWPDQLANDATLAKSHDVTYYHSVRELVFPSGNRLSRDFRAGDWIVLRVESHKDLPMHARILQTTYWPTVQISEFVPMPAELYQGVQAANEGSNRSYQHYYKPSQNASSKEADEKSKTELPMEPQPAKVFVYQQNFDELTDHAKCDAIVYLLDILPSVREMRAYLTKKSSISLAHWVDRMSPAGIGLLRWIIASSRACIVAIPEPGTPESSGVSQDGVTAPDKSSRMAHKDERLAGMDGWVQFRFAMGAPDKERRFIRAVRSTTERKKLQYPTIFAWHGSPLHNWHSIIREGLHFNSVVNGRAYGDGVYHSPNAQTSIGYTGAQYYSRAASASWPQSELSINTALALNEIVNAPDEFVSQNPHYVVQHVDWIQTRYLFVKVASEITQKEVPLPKDVHEQDPKRIPMGDQGKPIAIPLKTSAATALNANRKRHSGSLTSFMKRVKAATGHKNDPIELDYDFDDQMSVATLAEDAAIFEAEHITPEPTKLPHNAKPMTDFVPGKLDYDDLPRLEMPNYATTSATKRLQQDFKSLLKVQAKEPAHELGWYIDPDSIDSMYQWIIELHSFESNLPLHKDMKEKGLTSIILELRFGKDYPMSPPFVRVVKPRFLTLAEGGGGHVTAGGALCMELLTNNGWSAVSSIESVLLQVRLAMSSRDPPARLKRGPPSTYAVGEAVEAYIRACSVHGWTVPAGFREIAYGGQPVNGHHDGRGV